MVSLRKIQRYAAVRLSGNDGRGEPVFNVFYEHSWDIAAYEIAESRLHEYGINSEEM